MPDRRLPAAVLALTLAGLGACGGGEGPQATVVAEIEVEPHVGPDIQVGDDGSVWLPASDTFGGTEVPYEDADHLLVRIDPRSQRVTSRVSLPHPMSALAVGGGGVWLTGTDFGPDDEQPRGSVVRVNPASGQIDLATQFDPPSSPTDVVVGLGSVWVSDSTADAVYRIDPDTGAVRAEIAVSGGPTSLAVAGGAVWVAKPATGEVRPIDPDTNRPGPPVKVGSDAAVLAAGRWGLAVADYAGNEVARVDVATGEVAEHVSFPSAPSRLDVGDDFAVASEVDERTLSVVRDGKRRVVLQDRVLVALALDGDDVWAADAGSGAVVQIRLPAD